MHSLNRPCEGLAAAKKMHTEASQAVGKKGEKRHSWGGKGMGTGYTQD